VNVRRAVVIADRCSYSQDQNVSLKVASWIFDNPAVQQAEVPPAKGRRMKTPSSDGDLTRQILS
jgi:hypothetical protein